MVQRLRLTIEDGDSGLKTADNLKAVELCFLGDYREPLVIDSLESEGDQLFCRIRNGAWRARFGRVALQQLAAFLVESENGPAIVINGVRHTILRRATPTPA